MKPGALVAVVVVAAAGCGGGGDHGRLSRSEYEAKLQSALTSGGLPMHVAPDPATESLGDVASRFDAIAAHLSRVRPPADVQALNDGLVAGAAKTASTLDALVAKMRHAPTAKRDRLLAEFDASHIPGLDQFNRAAAALSAKGYRFSSTSGT